MEALAFLDSLSLIPLTIAFAFSWGIPWVSLISRRTVSLAAGVTAPSSRFFTGTPRLTSLVCSTSSSAFILKRSEEHTSELQSRVDLVCRLLLEKKNGLPNEQQAVELDAYRQ